MAKALVGYISGSLGVFSEALHSFLDLMAAGMTVYAVRESRKPPDQEHHFGHGKIENLSAFFETLLLLVTAGWIIWEAFLRLIDPRPPEVDVWPIAVMVVSVAVNLERARILSKTAKKHGSQALEADALHFWADAVTSVAVLLGLGATIIGVSWADPASALIIAVVLVIAAIRLIRRSLDALLDRAPDGAETKIRMGMDKIGGICGKPIIRIRPQGHILHVDIVVKAEGSLTIRQGHEIANTIENGIRKIFPDADVVIHIEPIEEDGVLTMQDRGD